MEKITKIIEARSDKEEVENEWLFLIDPFVKLIQANGGDNVGNFYVTQSSHSYSMNLEGFSNSVSLELDNKKGATQRNYSLLSGGVQNEPIILIGDPGIGKSTWIKQFFSNSVVTHLHNKKIHYIYYDHHSEAGMPFGHIDKIIRMRRAIAYDVVEILQDFCTDNEINSSIFDINLCELESKIDSDTSALDSRSIIRKVKDGVDRLRDKGIEIWILIDNLDRYCVTEQKNGFKIANSLSRNFGLKSIITMRPYTYTALRGRGIYGNVLLLQPPSLGSVIEKRLEYLKGYESGSKEYEQFDIDCHFIRFKSMSLDMSWAKNIYSVGALLSLYETMAKVIASNRTLLNLLNNIRHYNIRRSLQDIAYLMKCGHFSKIIRKDIEDFSKNIPKALDWQIITAYLRGPYRRHHGRTQEYPLNITNMFDIPGIAQEYSLIGIRMINMLNKHTSYENALFLSFVELKDKLSYYGYHKLDIGKTVEFLIKRRIVYNITESRDHDDINVMPKNSDCLSLTCSGRYYIEYFMKKYALRYVEAMADVTYFQRAYFYPRDENNTVFKKDKNVTSIVNNALLLLEKILHIVKIEVNRLASEDSDRGPHKKIKDFFSEFNNREGFFYALIYNIKENFEKIIDKNPDLDSEVVADLTYKCNEIYKEALNLRKLKDIYC